MPTADPRPARPAEPARTRAATAALALALVAALVGAVPARAAATPATAPVGQPAAPVAAVATSAAAAPSLSDRLNAVMAFSPPDSCLSVSIDGKAVYQHDASTPRTPASTEKLLTATVALEQLGHDFRFRTSVVAAAPPVNGVVNGDVTLIGSGDPTLTTDAYRFVERIGGDRPSTSLDALAAQLAAAGITRITGRVIGDETRYDQARSVPSWPDRYVRQDQTGPLSALTVDDGFLLQLPAPGTDDSVKRVRSADPAGDAARMLSDRLRLRGIQVDGVGGGGAAPANPTELTAVRSAPLSGIVGEMLTFSDNQIGELLAKELGKAKGAGGTTAAGAAVIAQRAGALGLPVAGTKVVDGSGLDPANKVTCDELVATLALGGGVDSTVAKGLPVAGRTGTLAGRFRGTPAEGRLRAKTGSLSGVTALAGFVPLTEGGTATFAYIANGRAVDAGVLAAQDELAKALATYLPPCPTTAPARLVAPIAPYAAQMGALSMFPLQSVLLPGAVVPLHVFEDRYRALVERCLAEAEDFGVVLISRGSEVGGGEKRTEVGTRARIVQAEQAPDGRWGVLAVGIGRLKVHEWLPDTPYPLASVADWPDPDPADDLTGPLAASAARLRRVLALRAELGESGPPATTDVDLTDPSLASFTLAALSPLGDLDRQRLLAAPDVADRLIRFDALLDEEEQVCRARLGRP